MRHEGFGSTPRPTPPEATARDLLRRAIWDLSPYLDRDTLPEDRAQRIAQLLRDVFLCVVADAGAMYLEELPVLYFAEVAAGLRQYSQASADHRARALQVMRELGFTEGA